jgi:hypothetical protein
MLEMAHRQEDGRLQLGKNLVTGEQRHLTIPQFCKIRSVTDDMALCHPSLNKDNGKLTLMDAEEAWFVRVNHIEHYGADPHLEQLTILPKKPLLFLNIDSQPGSTALIWEHIEDEPGKPCPNPRVIIPADTVPRSASRNAGYRYSLVRSALPAVDTRESLLTALWDCSICCRRRWPGCGGWWRRADTPTRV